MYLGEVLSLMASFSLLVVFLQATRAAKNKQQRAVTSSYCYCLTLAKERNVAVKKQKVKLNFTFELN